MTSRRVVIIGDAMVDIVVQPTEPPAPTSDTSANIRMLRGGSGANIAATLVAHGHEVTYVAAIGEDLGGAVVRDDLTRCGVVSQLQTCRASTGTVVVLVAPDGQRAMMTDRGANRMLSLEFVLHVLDESWDHVHVSGYTVLDSDTRGVARAALDVARTRAMTTSVDVCSVAPLADVSAPVFLRACTGASYLFANEEEALELAGELDIHRALARLGDVFEEVVITRGVRGAMAMRHHVSWGAGAQGDNVVDTTGAGDAATGAYLSARLRDAPPPMALRSAMAAAANVIRGLGAAG